LHLITNKGIHSVELLWTRLLLENA